MSENPYESPPTTIAQSPGFGEGGRKRHGCVTTWLVMLAIGCVFGTIQHLLLSTRLLQSDPQVPIWASLCFIVCFTISMGSIIAIFNWKAWGFDAYLFSSLLAAGIAYWSGLGASNVFWSVAGCVFLYGILQLGKPRSAWSQLE